MKKEYIKTYFHILIDGILLEGFYNKINELLILASEFYDKSDDEIKEELAKMRFAAVLYMSYKALNQALADSTERNINISYRMSDYGLYIPEDVVTQLYIDKVNPDFNIKYIIKREKALLEDINKLNLDCTLILAWLYKSINKST